MIRQRIIKPLVINFVLAIICLVWITPTIGLLITSFRPPESIKSTGWWSVIPHRDWVVVEQISDLPRDIPSDIPFSISGVDNVYATYDEWKTGIQTSDGRLIQWAGNKRIDNLLIQEKQWVWNPDSFTVNNYLTALVGRSYELTNADGSTQIIRGENLMDSFLNTITMAVPSALIPLLIAAFGAYGFAWMNFKGRGTIFVIVIALLAVPYQVAIIPILRDFTKLNINGTFFSVWIAHTGFALPLAIYYLYNAISGLPREMLESAFMDGATHFKVFYHLVTPTTIPTIVSFAIFQFIWTWNDYLVNLVFLGDKNPVLTKRLTDLVGERGADWHLLTAGAFISMLLPLLIFFALQKYFVRGLLAGSVKG